METMMIVCPHCGARNRVPAARMGEGGKCGKCGKALFTGSPIALSAARFDRHAASDLPLLVDFWASWCGPCRAMAPVFETLAKELEPRLRFGKVDTDAEPQLSARYGIQSIPTLILFQAAKEKNRVSGALPAAALRNWIGQNL